MKINPHIKNSRREPSGLLISILFAVLLAQLTGCGLEEQKPQKLKDLDYTIVEESEIPQKLMETIEERKEGEFKASFENEDGLYLVHGYGEQETGGYSIVVRNLYLTKQALYFDTELLGPENGSDPPKKPSYPYIVVKTEKQEQNIVFE